jgi:hypothetical protein
MWEETVYDFPSLIVLKEFAAMPKPIQLCPSQNDKTAQS